MHILLGYVSLWPWFHESCTQYILWLYKLDMHMYACVSAAKIVLLIKVSQA